MYDNIIQNIKTNQIQQKLLKINLFHPTLKFTNKREKSHTFLGYENFTLET